MVQRTLARTGVHVSPLCLGAMMFGAWGETDHDACLRIVHRALDAGINFIDTAGVYSRGESEEIVGDALGRLADDAGMSLIDMALAFVIRHPAVTAAIVGPRTLEQLESQLGAADVVLDTAVLDRIDEIVAPATTINPSDAGWTNPALAPAARRR